MRAGISLTGIKFLLCERYLRMVCVRLQILQKLPRNPHYDTVLFEIILIESNKDYFYLKNVNTYIYIYDSNSARIFVIKQVSLLTQC